MNYKLLSCIIIFFSISIIGCEENKSDNEVFPKQLTTSNSDRRCFWSPNGEKIAFLSTRDTYDPMASGIIFEIWVMDNDGSNQRPLLSFDELYEVTNVVNVSWSPDSDALLAQITFQGGSEIWKISRDGNKAKMTSMATWAERPKYSPNGLKVAFIIQGPNPAQGSPVYRLYSADPDFSDTVLIEKGLIGDYEWTHDSEGFIYSLYDRTNENFDLWNSSTSGTEKSRLSETPEDEEIITCSYDGKYISYSDHKAVYLTPADIFNSSLLLDSARLPVWISNRNLVLLYRLQTQDNKTWTEPWIVDINGNVILKIQEGSFSEAAFSSSGDYYAYTKEGNIWLDKLPY